MLPTPKSLLECRHNQHHSNSSHKPQLTRLVLKEVNSTIFIKEISLELYNCKNIIKPQTLQPQKSRKFKQFEFFCDGELSDF